MFGGKESEMIVRNLSRAGPVLLRLVGIARGLASHALFPTTYHWYCRLRRAVLCFEIFRYASLVVTIHFSFVRLWCFERLLLSAYRYLFFFLA